MKKFNILLIVALFIISTSSFATTYYWTGIDAGSGFGIWSDPANWSTTSGGTGDGVVPTNSDLAIFDGSGTIVNCQIDADVDVMGIHIQGTGGPNGAYTGTIDFDGNSSAFVVGASGFLMDAGIFDLSAYASNININGNFAQSNGVVDCPLAGNFIITGTYTLSGGTFSAPPAGSYLEVNNNFSKTGGTFIHNSGETHFAINDLIVLNATDQDITFYDLYFDANNAVRTYTIGSGRIIQVDGTLGYSGSGTSGIFLNKSAAGAAIVDIKGNVDVSGGGSGATTGGGNATVRFSGPGGQILTGNTTPGNGPMPNVEIAMVGGQNLTINQPVTIAGNWVYSSGGEAINGLVIFNKTNTITGNQTFKDIQFYAQNADEIFTIDDAIILKAVGVSGGNIELSGTNKITINKGTGTGQIDVQRNITLSNTATGGGGTALIKLVSTNSKASSISGNLFAGQSALPKVEISKGALALTLNNIISVANDFTYTTSGALTSTGSTLYMNGGGQFNYVPTALKAFNNLTFNASSPVTYSITTTNATGCVVDGILEISGSGAITWDRGAIGTINLRGTTAGATLTLNNTSSLGTLGSATPTFNFIVPTTSTASHTINGSASIGESRLPNITINRSGTGAISMGSTIMSVLGDWTHTAGNITVGTSTVIFTGGTAQNINGAITSTTFNNLTVNKSALGVTLGGSITTLTLGGALTMTAGTFDLGSVATAVNIAGDVTLTAGTLNGGSANAVISMNGAGNDWNANGGTFTVNTSKVNFTGSGIQNIQGSAASASFNNLEIVSSGTTNISGTVATVNVAGNFTLTTGTFAPGANTLDLTGATSSWSHAVAGIFTPGTSTVRFSGSGMQTITTTGTASETFYNLVCAKSASTLSCGATPTTITCNNNLTVSGFTFTAPATLNVTGNALVSGGTLTGGTTVSVTGNVTVSSGLFTGPTTLSVAGTMNLTGGTLSAGTTINMTNANTVWLQDMGATFTNNASTVNFQGTTTNTFAGTATTYNFYNLAFAGAMTAPSSTLKIRHNLTGTAATFVHNNGTVEFDGVIAQDVSNAGGAKLAFYNLQATGAANTVTMSVDADIVNGVSITNASILDADGTGNTQVFTLKSSSTKNGVNTVGTAWVGDLTSGTLSGNVTWERQVDGFTDWRMMAFPISGKTIANFADDITTSGFVGSTDPGSSFVSVYTHTEGASGGTFNAPTVAGTGDPISADAVSGGGFFVYVGNSSPGTAMTPLKIYLIGTVIDGDAAGFTINTSHNGDGFSLVQNPYPAPINFTNVTLTNLKSQYSVWDSQANNYVTWDEGTGSSDFPANRTNGDIANGQAVWVEAAAGGVGSIKFDENDKSVATDMNFLKTAANDFKKIHLKLSTGVTQYYDNTVVAFSSTSSNSYAAEDATKLASFNPQAPYLASVADGHDLVINKLADLTTDIAVPLRVKVGINGQYTITATDISEAPGSCLILEDLLTSIQTDLRSTPSYSFNITDTTNAPRFVLHFSNPLTVSTTTAYPTCNGSSDGKLVATPTGTGPFTYVWKDNNNLTVQTNTSSLADTLKNVGAGMFSVTVSTNGGCANAITQNFNVTDPAPIVAAFAPNNTIVNINDVVTFTNTSSGATSYTWNFGDAGTSNLPNPQHTYTNAGTYTITLTATNGSCPISSATVVITVQSTTGIKSVQANNQVFISTNSNGTYLNINFESQVSGTVEVFDMLGKTIFAQSFNGTKTTERLNLPSDIAIGMYAFKINANGILFTQKSYISK